MRKSHRTSRAVFLFVVVVMPDQCRQLLPILRMQMYGIIAAPELGAYMKLERATADPQLRQPLQPFN